MKYADTTEFYVIFAKPRRPYQEPMYFDMQGMPTQVKSQAAKFFSWEEAKEFARRNRIRLNDKTIFIGREAFEVGLPTNAQVAVNERKKRG